MTQGKQVVRVADKDWGIRHHLDAAGGGVTTVAGARGVFHAVKSNVQQQRADHPALRRSLVGRGETLAMFEHTRLQPAADHSPGGEPTEHHEKVVVIDVVERRCEVLFEVARLRCLEDSLPPLRRERTPRYLILVQAQALANAPVVGPGAGS